MDFTLVPKGTGKILLLLMYILKTKGTGKIPDYIQIRNNNFVLTSHFNAKEIYRQIENTELNFIKEKIASIIELLPYGIMRKFEINNKE